jgi:hypothetical protein
MKQFEMTLDGADDDLNYYYSEWHVSGDLKNFLDAHINKKVKITIEVLSEEIEEETVNVTYKELFNRVNDEVLVMLGVSLYYMNLGGDPYETRNIPKSIAMSFMTEEEFNGRKN